MFRPSKVVPRRNCSQRGWRKSVLEVYKRSWESCTGLDLLRFPFSDSWIMNQNHLFPTFWPFQGKIAKFGGKQCLTNPQLGLISRLMGCRWTSHFSPLQALKWRRSKRWSLWRPRVGVGAVVFFTVFFPFLKIGIQGCKLQKLEISQCFLSFFWFKHFIAGCDEIWFSIP